MGKYGAVDAEGRFEIVFESEDYRRVGIQPFRTPERMRASCAVFWQCGSDQRSGRNVPGQPNEEWGLFNVPDISIDGLAARLVTDFDFDAAHDRGQGGSAGNRDPNVNLSGVDLSALTQSSVLSLDAIDGVSVPDVPRR